jgi:tetratricopeptide (TPR) repeat protein
MHQYGVRDVERLLRLSRATIRALVAAGFVTPSRGRRNDWRFSFQDLIVLRTAQALVDARVPQRRITRSLRQLRRQLPESMPLSGLSIGAVGDRVVVREGGSRWQAESGQYLLEFEAAALPSTSAASQAPGRPHPTHEWFERALANERSDPAAALAAYARAVAEDPAHLDARLNWGTLLHELGRHAEAERVYRDALEVLGGEAVLLYNLGVLLDDMERRMEAVQAYAAALRANPALADGHYNLALLYQELGRPKDAIRHMAQYRKLLG